MKTLEKYQINKSLLPDFDTLWSLRPESGNVVIVRDKETGEYKEKTIFRQFQSYLRTPGFDDQTGKSYMFSGSRCPEETFKDLPLCLNTLSFYYWDYDNCVVNWYEPEDYIEEHSDCQAKLDPNYSIVVINLNEPDTEPDRYFNVDGTSILLEDGLVLSITDQKHSVGPGQHKRISITFRKLK